MADLNITLTVSGVGELVERLMRVTSPATRLGPMQRLTERLQKRLRTYPPELPGQQYVRTGDLGAAWQITAATAQFGELRNAVEDNRGRPYAGWVQGHATQAAIHQGRWETDEQALQVESGPFLNDVKQTVQAAWG